MCDLHVQVLASDVDHSSPSLMLVFDKGGRFIFNSGEGLQRLMRESKIKMAKVGQNLLHPPARPLSSYAPVPVPVTQLEHYFFTRVSTETMSGLPGIMGESALRVQCELHFPLFNHLFICEASS